MLWEHEQQSSESEYNNSLRPICTFKTIEDFWKYWSYVPRPSEVFFDGQQKRLVNGRFVEGFSLFKKDIRPEWEDPANSKGGELTCRKNLDVNTLDLYWENLVLGLIGETIDEADEICGCRVVDKGKQKPGNKTMFKLELWLRTDSQGLAEKLRPRLCECLGDGEITAAGKRSQNMPAFEYKAHKV